MTKKLILGIILGLCGLPAAQAQWGEYVAEYKFKGFSPDLKFAAYEMVEPIYNPSAEITRTSIFVINVDKNSYAMKHFQFDADSLDDPEFLKAYANINRTVATQFGIKGNLRGDSIKFEAPNKDTYPFSANGESYRLVVKKLPVPGTDNEGEVMVEVALLYKNQVITLQAPEKAPDSWGRTIDYRLRSGFVLKNKVAIFLDYYVSDIELPSSTRQMIVTGVLPGKAK